MSLLPMHRIAYFRRGWLTRLEHAEGDCDENDANRPTYANKRVFEAISTVFETWKRTSDRESQHNLNPLLVPPHHDYDDDKEEDHENEENGCDDEVIREDKQYEEKRTGEEHTAALSTKEVK